MRACHTLGTVILMPVVLTIFEILTTPTFIPVEGKPIAFYVIQTISRMLDSGCRNDFGSLHFQSNSGKYHRKGKAGAQSFGEK